MATRMLWYPREAVPPTSVGLVILGFVLALLAGFELAVAHDGVGTQREIVVQRSAS